MTTKSQSIEDVLKSVGMEEHQKKFKDEEIDSELFLSLTLSDLKGLAIPMGHAIKIAKKLDEIRNATNDLVDVVQSIPTLKHTQSRYLNIKKGEDVKPNVVLKEDTPDFANDMYKTMKDKVTTQFGEKFNLKDIRSIKGVSQFPYGFYDRNQYNSKTIQFISSTFSKTDENTLVKDQGYSFYGEYDKIWASLNYSFSQSDKAKLAKAQNDSQGQLNSLIETYKYNISDKNIGQYSGVELQNYVLTQIYNWASPPTTLLAIQKARDLSELLNKTPPGGEQVYPDISAYLDKYGPAVTLLDLQTRSLSTRKDILFAMEHNTTPNTYLVDENGDSHPSFTITPSQYNQIESGLNETGNQISVNISVTTNEKHQFSASVEGHASLFIPVDWFIGKFGGGGNYNYSKDVEINSKMDITITWSGVTVVNPIDPLGYDFNTRAGWFYSSPIQEAVSNIGQDRTGWKFGSDQKLPDFENDFGLVNALILSSQPTISINYTGSNSSDVQTKWEANQSAGFSLFGLFDFGSTASQKSFDQNYKKTETGFSVTFKPPSVTNVILPFDRTAFVLGATSQFLGHPKSSLLNSSFQPLSLSMGIIPSAKVLTMGKRDFYAHPNEPELYIPVTPKYYVLSQNDCQEVSKPVYDMIMLAGSPHLLGISGNGVKGIGGLKFGGKSGSSSDKREKSWIAFWERETGETRGLCAVAGCGNSATVGGHITLKSTGLVYITPICSTHNGVNWDGDDTMKGRVGAKAVQIDYP